MRRKSASAAAVTAAFLGPGTITVCSRAGAQHGFALLWVLLVSLVVLWIAQERCARLGILGRVSLAQGLTASDLPATVQWSARLLVVLALGIGCAAYQAGNLSGAAQGLRVLTDLDPKPAFLYCTIPAAALLCVVSRERLLTVLVFFVLLMTLCFLIAALCARPSPLALLRGLFQPSIPADLDGHSSFLSVAALVGTTIVPYNLFLHSSLARDRATGEEGYRRERRELACFLPVGILVSMSVLVTAACAFQGMAEPPRELSAMAGQLERPLGAFGRHAFAVGILAAGLSSALTAPLAAGLAVSELWRNPPRWLAGSVRWLVMAIGIGAGLMSDRADRPSGITQTDVIHFAQIANAVLLPLSLGFLMWATWRPGLLGQHRTGRFATFLGLLAVLGGLLLALRTVLSLMGSG